MTSFDGGVK